MRTLQFVTDARLIPNWTILQRFSYNEHQIELQDGIIQLYGEPKELTLLNIDRSTQVKTSYVGGGPVMLQMVFDLSQTIKKERR